MIKEPTYKTFHVQDIVQDLMMLKIWCYFFYTWVPPRCIENESLNFYKLYLDCDRGVVGPEFLENKGMLFI